MLAVRKKGRFYHVPAWELRGFLVPVRSLHGAQLQQDGGQCPSPACALSQAKDTGDPFAVLSVRALSWCSCAFACAYVIPPRDTTAGSFSNRGSCFSEKTLATFWRNGSWKEKWKEGSANKGMFLVWLLVLFSFLPAGPWVAAVLLLRWESRECSSWFFPQTRLDLVSLPTSTCRSVGESWLQ